MYSLVAIRARRSCSHRGCPETVHPPERYCPTHATDCNQYRKQYDEHRETAPERGYDWNWRRTRRMYLFREPFCELCGRQAQDVHHIKPLAEGGNNAFENLQALCRACHNEITHGSGKEETKGK